MTLEQQQALDAHRVAVELQKDAARREWEARRAFLALADFKPGEIVWYTGEDWTGKRLDPVRMCIHSVEIGWSGAEYRYDLAKIKKDGTPHANRSKYGVTAEQLTREEAAK